MHAPSPSTNDLVSSFTANVYAAVHHFFPANTVWFHPTDKPWITARIKQLIKERQQAFHSGDAQLWCLYRRKVQSEIKTRKRKFYEEKVWNTRKDDVRQWWRTVNVMSGRTNSQSCFTLEPDDVALSEGELAESLNQYFATVAAHDTWQLHMTYPLDTSCLPSFLPSARELPIVHSHVVCKKLLQVKRNKAMGPDSISPRIIKEFAYELTEPVTKIFNKSFSTDEVPILWKCSNNIPIPKVKQPLCESDTRPISLTPILS